MTTLPDILETTPQAITSKQGGDLWLVSTADGLLHLYKAKGHNSQPVTVFVRDEGGIRSHVRYAYADDYQMAEY